MFSRHLEKLKHIGSTSEAYYHARRIDDGPESDSASFIISDVMMNMSPAQYVFDASHIPGAGIIKINKSVFDGVEFVDGLCEVELRVNLVNLANQDLRWAIVSNQPGKIVVDLVHKSWPDGFFVDITLSEETQAEIDAADALVSNNDEADSYQKMVKYAAYLKNLYNFEKEQKELAQALLHQKQEVNSKMHLIKTEGEYQSAMERLLVLMDHDLPPGSDEEAEFELLTLLIENYEQKIVSPVDVDPIEAILFRMEQQNLTRKDLLPYIGSMSKVSEVLSRKRALSLAMIRKLHEGLGIPANILIKAAPKEQKRKRNV